MPSLSHFTASRRSAGRGETLLAQSEGNGRHFRRTSKPSLTLSPGRVRLAIAQRLSRRSTFLAQRTRVTRTCSCIAPGAVWRRLGTFFWTDFARRFRAAWRYLLAAAAVARAAIAAYIGALLDPTLRDALVPAQMRQVMQNGRTWTDIQPAMRPGIVASSLPTTSRSRSSRSLAGCCSDSAPSTCW